MRSPRLVSMAPQYCLGEACKRNRLRGHPAAAAAESFFPWRFSSAPAARQHSKRTEIFRDWNFVPSFWIYPKVLSNYLAQIPRLSVAFHWLFKNKQHKGKDLCELTALTDGKFPHVQLPHEVTRQSVHCIITRYRIFYLKKLFLK